MRALALVAVAVLAAATFVVPQPSEPVPRAPDAAAPAPYSVCPLGEAARRSATLTAVGGAEGAVPASVFSGGEIQASGELAMSESGTGVLDVGELTGLARAPLLLALDDPGRVVETILGGVGVAASACGTGSSDAQIMPGGATVEGDSYIVVLANPFAGSATVDVLAASEVGPESDPALEGIVVPPRSVIELELSNILPGRQAMSAAAVAAEGRVVAGAVHESNDDISAVGGLEPDLDWYVPVPEMEGAGGSVVLFAPGTAEIPFQLDVYASDGVVEAAYEDSVPAEGQAVIPTSELMEGAGMVRVVAAGPVAAALSLSGEAGLAVVPGTATPAPTWLLPGAGQAGGTQVHVFNPGELGVRASLLSGTGEEIETFDVPASSMVDVELPAQDAGARLEADGDLAVHWTTPGEEGLAGDAARATGG